MSQVNKPAIPIKLETQYDETSKEVLRVLALFLENIDKLSVEEKTIIVECLKTLAIPSYKIAEGKHAPIEVEWVKTQRMKGLEP